MSVYAPGPGAVILLTHAGAPSSSDGPFSYGQTALDTNGVFYVCKASGTPGTWTAITGSGSGTISDITSNDGSLVVTNPTGPTTDISAATSLALKLSLTGGTMSGAIAMGTHKITGVGLASASTDAASLANTIDQFGAPAANVAWNAKKITGLANGTASTDAAAFGQITAANAGAVALSVVTTAGDLIVATGSGTVTRLASGAAGTALLGQGAGVAPAYGVLPGTLLASQQYAPGTLDTISVTSASLTALDTTNLTLSLTVPASGNVDIEVEFFLDIVNSSGGTDVSAALLNHSGGAQVGNTIGAITSNAAATIGENVRLRFHLTGLSAGALQLDLALATSSTTGSATNVLIKGATGAVTGSGFAPFLMQAFAA